MEKFLENMPTEVLDKIPLVIILFYVLVIAVVIYYVIKANTSRKIKKSQQLPQQIETPPAIENIAVMANAEIDYVALEDRINKIVDARLEEIKAKEKQQGENESFSLKEYNKNKGQNAEARVKNYLLSVIQNHKIPAQVFNQCNVSDNLRLDHLILGTFGAIIIETKSLNGYIYGRRNDAEWLKVYVTADNYNNDDNHDHDDKCVRKIFFSRNYCKQVDGYTQALEMRIKKTGKNIPVFSFLVFVDTENYDDINYRFHCRLSNDCMSMVRFLNPHSPFPLGETIANIINDNSVPQEDIDLLAKELCLI